MNDDSIFIGQVAEKLATVPGVLAVVLGGSRATGNHRPDSDFDFAIYYRKRFDPNDLRALGWPGQVSEVGGWGGGVMNGGAWLDVDGRHVDVHYRDLDEVDYHIAEAEAGRFNVERLPFYLAGIPTYMVVGELAMCKVLVGSLPRPEYPAALQRTARYWWHEAAKLSLLYGEGAYAVQGDPLGVAGSLARAIMEEAHSRLAARGEWVFNEKRLVTRAGLDALKAKFARLGTTPDELKAVIGEVRSAIEAAQLGI